METAWTRGYADFGMLARIRGPVRERRTQKRT